MKLGITGTRDLPNGAYNVIYNRLIDLQDESIEEFTCGGAKGVDQVAAGFATAIFPNALMRLVLPKEYDGEWVDEIDSISVIDEIIYTGLPPLLRNHVILDHTDHLEAFPKTSKEERRSGTWATIRYARQRNIITCINPLVRKSINA